MTDKTTHSSDAELMAVLTSDDDDVRFDSVAAHLETCPACRQRLENLAGPPSLDREAGELLSGHDGQGSDRGKAGEHRAGPPPNADAPLGFLRPAGHPEMLGRLGRYDIERVIGSGGMGVVLKAFDTDLNRPVAIKALAPHLSYVGAARQRFALEAKAVAAVVHENVVAIHDVQTDDGVPFLVMQYVSGESLQARIDREGPLTAREILRIGIQASAGLAAAHAQGIVHRDIKPGNILLENGVERALITDFGLARTVTDASLTQTGVICGTPGYMSPEQVNGGPADQRTDLFSLGAVLYFMATGHPPFRAECAMGVLNRVCHHRQKPLWQVAEDVPDEFSLLVDRMLAKKPSKRPATAEEVHAEMLSILSGLQSPAHGFNRRWRRKLMRFSFPMRRLDMRAILIVVVCLLLAVTAELVHSRAMLKNSHDRLQWESARSRQLLENAGGGTTTKPVRGAD